MSRLVTSLQYGVLLVLAVELAVEEAFLVGARPFGHAFPVAAVAAVVGNLLIGAAGAWVLRRPVGAAVPGVLWLGVALTLGMGSAGGDRVIPATWRGNAFVVAGLAAAIVAVGRSRAIAARATPEDFARR